MPQILYIILSFVAGFCIAFYLVKVKYESKISEKKHLLTSLKDGIEKDKKSIQKAAELELKEKLIYERKKLEDEFKQTRNELLAIEKRLSKKDESITDREKELNQTSKQLQQKSSELKKKLNAVENSLKNQKEKLEKIANLTEAEAKKQLFEQIEKETKYEAAKFIKKYEDEADKVSEKYAKKVISLAIQRCAADVVSENAISIVNLPSEDMKGRIIGREGRNIREFERCTGVDLIIDDTPEVVVISSFDSIRREVARLALEKLIEDGRIHPGRIEELVEKTKKELSVTIVEAGEQAIIESGVPGIKEDEVKCLGKLKFRTSYGQNVLRHSIEVSRLAGIMASELGANVTMAKKIGLLHDIGKALDHDSEGTHANLGAEFARKVGENDIVVHAIAAHHGEVPFKTVEGVLVAAADAISAARPGARRENIETYIKRLKELEKIATDKEVVEKAYAIQAGREIRVVVIPEKINDDEMNVLSREIANEIEDKLEYPGMIKVTIIRESRAITYAK